MSIIFLVPGNENKDHIDFIRQEFEVEKIIAVSKQKISSDLYDEVVIIDDVWEDIFKIIKENKENIKDSEIIIGPITGCEELDLALTNAGFINGLKVLAVQKNKIVLLPLFKFSIYKELTDKKLEIVKLLFQNPDYELNLETIGTKTKMSPPLVSYHINGNLKSEGLKELGIVTSRDDHGKSYVKLTKLGILAIKGFL